MTPEERAVIQDLLDVCDCAPDHPMWPWAEEVAVVCGLLLRMDQRLDRLDSLTDTIDRTHTKWLGDVSREHRALSERLTKLEQDAADAWINSQNGEHT